MKKLTFLSVIMGMYFVCINGCTSDNPDECDIYCHELTACSETLDLPFSNARCERDCRDDRQAYELVNCDDEFVDYLDCRSDLSCTEQNDVGNECADEIDDLNRCLD